MEKYEILFAILIIIAYIICSLTLKIPIHAHLMFGAILLVVLIIAILLKFKQKYENEKISGQQFVDIMEGKVTDRLIEEE